MANQYFNFYYSPIRQGFDSSTWSTLFGNPVVSSNRLVLQDAAIIHWGDILRGDATFSVNIPAPAVGLSKKFGFFEPNKNAYAYFSIAGGVLYATCSDGSSTTSVAITWQASWTSADTEFRVKWEAGTVKFYIGTIGTAIEQAVINDVSVSGDPMSIYVSDEGSDTVLLNYITVKGIQSFMMSEGNENTIWVQKLIYAADGVSISDVITILVPTLFAPANGGITYDSMGLVDLVTSIDLITTHIPPKNDNITITESVTVAQALSMGVNVNDSLTVTDVRTVGSPA